jgi:hypothetical protein
VGDPIKVAKDVVEAFNKEDWDRSMSLLGSGLYNEIGTGRQLRGETQILPALKAWRKAMPDVKGTETGPLEGPGGTLPPSGKRQSTPAAWIFEVEGDRVKESRQYFDMMSFMQQIGAIPQA